MTTSDGETSSKLQRDTNGDEPELFMRRWKRYGKDHLYVTAQGGRDVGRVDLVTGNVRVTEPDLVMHFDAAVSAWCDEHGVILDRSGEEKLQPEAPPSLVPALAPDLPPPPEPPRLDDMPPPPVPLSSTPQPSTAPTVAPAPEWHDLATNRAGQAAREQAIAARKAHPILNFLARGLGQHTDERAWRVGADGEERVGSRLRKLDERWYVLHSVPVGRGDSDIDHVVIGPGGVFTLNTKTHPGAKVWVAENSFLVKGQRTPYLRNSRHEATRAAKLLTAVCGFEVAVEPVIVVLCEELKVKAQPDGVRVCSSRRVRKWLSKHGRGDVPHPLA